MNTAALAVALTLSLGGGACLYLASPNQQLRAAPLPWRPALLAGSGLGLGGLAAFAWVLHPVAAVFTFTLWLMLVLVALPHVGAVVTRLRGST